MKQLAWKNEYRKRQLDRMIEELRRLDLEPDMLVDDVETEYEMMIIEENHISELCTEKCTEDK